MVRTRTAALVVTAAVALSLVLPTQAFAALSLLSSATLAGTPSSFAYESTTGKLWIAADSAFGDANHPTAYTYAFTSGGVQSAKIDGTARTANLFADSSLSQVLSVPIGTGSPTIYNSVTNAAGTTYTGPNATVKTSGYNAVTRKLYSPLLASNTLSITDMATGAHSTVSLPITVMGSAYVDAVSNKVFMLDYTGGMYTGKMAVVDGATDTVSTVNFGRSVTGIAIAPAAGKVYATSGDYLMTYNVSTATITEVSLGANGYGMLGYFPLAGKVILMTAPSGVFHYFPYDPNTSTMGAEITAAVGLSVCGLNQATNAFYLVNTSTFVLSELDVSTSAVTGTYALGWRPRAVAPLGTTGVILAASLNTKDITFLNGALSGGSSSGGGTTPTTPTTPTSSVSASSWWSVALLAIAGLGALALRRRKASAAA